MGGSLETASPPRAGSETRSPPRRAVENEDLNELMRLADAKQDGKIDYLGNIALCS